MFTGSVSMYRSAVLVATAGLTLVLAAGCSGTPSSGGSSGSRAASSGSGAAASPGQAIELAAAHAAVANSVTADFAVHGSGTDAMTISGSSSEVVRPQLEVEVNVPTDSVAGQTVPGGMTEIIASQNIYMRSSQLSRLIGGKPWLRVPYSELDKVFGADFEQLAQQAQNDNPLVQTQLLPNATDVRVVGTGTINGVRVTEYSGSYSMSQALSHLPTSLGSQFRQQFAKSGITSVSFTVWLDDQQQVMKLIDVNHGSTGSVTVTMLVTSINKPVTVTIPPSSEVVSIPLSALPSRN